MSDKDNEELLDELESLKSKVEELTESLKETSKELAHEKAMVNDLQIQLAQAGTAQPAGDKELRALAATIRNCQKNGHPDFGKHVDSLLRKLGA